MPVLINLLPVNLEHPQSWNVRKCSASLLDTMCVKETEHMLELLTPYIESVFHNKLISKYEPTCLLIGIAKPCFESKSALLDKWFSIVMPELDAHVCLIIASHFSPMFFKLCAG